MYKKITTIEEYSDPNHGKQGIYLPTNAFTTDSVNLRLKIRDVFAKYVAGFRNYVISKQNNTKDVNSIQNQIKQLPVTFAVLYTPYLTQEQSKSISDSLNLVTEALISVVDDLCTSDNPSPVSIDNAKKAISHLSMVMTTTNLMNGVAANGIWENFLLETQRQVAFRRQNKWDDEQTSYGSTYYLMVAGDTGITSLFSSYADLFFKGLIANQ